MNNARRKIIAEAVTLLEQARDLLEQVRDEEQETFGNMPESLQQSERGQLSEQWASALDNSFSNVESALSGLEVE